MSQKVEIIGITSSFEHIWAPVVESTQAIVHFRMPSELTGLADASVIIIAAGGAESEARSTVIAVAAACGEVPIAVAGALPDHRLALELVHAGADEYFALPGDMKAVADWLTLQVQHHRRPEAGDVALHHPRFDYSHIIGHRTGLRAALELTSRITQYGDASVLITGETGTGKELIAHAIHYNGPRAGHTLVEVNCSALPANLVEAELFGYEAGAFTDARAAKPGLFEIASGGTLFLDEVGELALDVQAKLLRVLDEKRVRRLGATHSVPVDARIVAATNVNLAAAARDKRFRQDLYYRLDVFGIHLPPLRDRAEDIIPIAEHFARQLSDRHGVPRLALGENAKRLLRQHPWPGNVRELRNVMERAVLLGDATLLLPDDTTAGEPLAIGTLPFPADMESIQQAAARAMVGRHRGNKSAAATALGISRKRLYSLLHGAVESPLLASRRAGTPHLPSFVQETVHSGERQTVKHAVSGTWFSRDDRLISDSLPRPWTR